MFLLAKERYKEKESSTILLSFDINFLKVLQNYKNLFVFVVSP